MSSPTVDRPIEWQGAPRLKHGRGVSQSNSWIWLAPAAVLLLFANGAYPIPLAAWLAPLFLLRFVRTGRARVVLPIAWAVLAATIVFQFRGMIPLPGVLYYAVIALLATALLVPYLFDCWLVPRLDGVAATFVFPAAWAATEYLRAFSPIATWGAAPYSQYGNLPLVQIVSVTGLWGVTFLIGWFAAVGNQIWQEGFDSRRSRRAAAAFAATLSAVFLLGGARLALASPSASTVRVASLSHMPVEVKRDPAVWERLLKHETTRADLEEVRRWGKAVADNLLERSEREARSGAKIIFWGEGNCPVLKEDEGALIERGQELARNYQVYLGMGLAAWNRHETKPLENKFVLLTPTGAVAWQYCKTHPVPGGEAAISKRDDGRLPLQETPYGRITSVICFDADFPALVAQAGDQRADILLDPSNDWPAIDPLHTWMASFRAIEQGVNLVRQTSQGLSAAYDYQGRVLAVADYYQMNDHVMIAQVPTRGVRTIYSRVGDAFAWLCLGMVAFLALRSWRARRSFPAIEAIV